MQQCAHTMTCKLCTRYAKINVNALLDVSYIVINHGFWLYLYYSISFCAWFWQWNSDKIEWIFCSHICVQICSIGCQFSIYINRNVIYVKSRFSFVNWYQLWPYPCVAYSNIKYKNLLEVNSGKVRIVPTSKKETRQKK